MSKNKEKVQKPRYSKGDFGYLNNHKKRRLLSASLSMLMVVVICMTGIILYHSQKTIFAVMAALAALPAAKLLVGYLVLMPYHSTDEAVRERLESVRGDNAYARILYDVVLSSSEKAMYAGVIFIKNGKIFGYTDYYKKNSNKNAKKQDSKAVSLSDIEKHLKFIINSNCNYSIIKMYDDEAAFLKAVEAEKTSEGKLSDEERRKLISMNERIAKQISIYMF